MLARLELRKGCTVPRHQHHHEQISSVLRGALRFVMGEEGAAVETIIREGEVLVIPGHVLHFVEAIEDTLALDVFAPPREDWISGDDAYLR
jgi:quercetin dioxygenase-like cupin family protein